MKMQLSVRLPSAAISLVSRGPGGLAWPAALDKSSQGRRCGALVRIQLQTTRRQIEWKTGLFHLIAVLAWGKQSRPVVSPLLTSRSGRASV
jgi:hypothetical protein